MMKTRGFLLAAAVAAMVFTLSCSSDDEGGGGTCSADFRTVTIGTQTWMAENLNCDVSGSKCYKDDPANCAKYGRLYDWATAMKLASSCNSAFCSSEIQSPHRGICPSGWHIPSGADWTVLRNYAGGSSTAGSKLKSTSGWNEHETYGNGTDEFGFSALPGGYGTSSGSFWDVGSDGTWWTANGITAHEAYSLEMSYNRNNASADGYSKSSLRSVRCLKD